MAGSISACRVSAFIVSSVMEARMIKISSLAACRRTSSAPGAPGPSTPSCLAFFWALRAHGVRGGCSNIGALIIRIGFGGPIML